MKLREATEDDLEALTDIMVAAMPTNSAWDYRFPYRGEYPEDHRRCVKRTSEEAFEAEATVLNVVEIEKDHPVAYAVWYRSPPAKQTGQEREDANPEHVEAWNEAMACLRQYTDNNYKKRYHLRLLATTPGYQGQGIGALLCKHVMEQGKKDSMALTLFASFEAHLLHARLGFKYIFSTVVQVKGKDQQIPVMAMAYETRSLTQYGEPEP
ncbi:MAG: hypothetical protein Q9171_006635 [Xanthocarpia ochracea]